MSYGPAIRPWIPSPIAWSVRVVTPDATEPVARLDGLADAALVALAVDGRPDAFDAIVVRHRRSVYQVCYRFVNNHEDAADLAQEAFVRAWRGLARFKGESALSTWLYRIAVNACLTRVSAKVPDTEPIGDSDRFEDAGAERPGAALARAERARAVRRAIQALPPRQRATLILRTYHELPHQQIAQIFGTSVGAVKANFFHALGNLRKILGSEP